MKRLLILLLILTLPLVSAEITDPKQISSASMKFSTTGHLNLEGNVKTLNLKLYAYPKTDYYNIISTIDTTPSAVLKTDEDHPYYQYTWNPIAERELDSYKQKLAEDQIDYSLTTRINSRFVLPSITKKQKFPYEPLGLYAKQYIQATDKVDNTEDVKRLANTLAEGETDAYALALKYAKYVSDIMTYDENYLDGTQKASWVLANKKGVCDEYVVLFMALSRAVGIPVRYVSGVAYSNIDTDFTPHAWAEVYINEAWIPFDPTYNEYGWVDATHIRMQETMDAEVSSIKYIWEAGDVEGQQPDLKVEIQDKELGLPTYLKTRIWIEESRVGFGSYNIIWMNIENPTNTYIVPEAYLSKSPQVIRDNYQYPLLEPYSSTLAYWVVKVPSDLDEKYTYSYSTESSVLFAGSDSLSFVADSKEGVMTLADVNEKLQTNITETSAGQPGLKVNIDRSEAYVGKPFEIRITAENNGNVAIPDLKICVEDCKTAYLGISEEVTKAFMVTKDVEGEHKIGITVTGEGINLAQDITVFVRKASLWEMFLDWLRSLSGS